MTTATWGKPYCDRAMYDVPEIGPVWMRRYRQRVRFFDRDGAQIGPEHTNVAPAVAYAITRREPRWRDLL